MRTGATRVVVERVGDTAVARELISGDFLAPRFVDARGLTVRIALVGHSATLLAGDDLRIEFVVAPGTCLEVIEPSGTVAYNARGDHAHEASAALDPIWSQWRGRFSQKYTEDRKSVV